MYVQFSCNAKKKKNMFIKIMVGKDKLLTKSGKYEDIEYEQLIII